MIEIQCTSCHTRYRIDERVLPADSPTFKCSRCGHVFTADPGVAKKAAAAAAKPRSLQLPTPRAEAIQDVAAAGPASAGMKTAAEPSQPPATEAESPPPRQATSEPKPAPVKPYVRNPRPTVFDRKPEPAPSKPEPATDATPEIDADAIARMKASMNRPKPAPTPPPSEPPRAKPTPPPAAQKDESDAQGENLEFDFNDESAPELGGNAEEDSHSAAESWSVGDAPEEAPLPRRPAFGTGAPDPGFSRGEPAPIGRGTIPQYAGRPPIQRTPLPDERGVIERSDLHSARSFIGLFFVVALVFVALTLVIYGIPNASAELLRRMPMIGPEFVQPTPLENTVNVSDVQSSYQRVKGGYNALVLTGTVKNNSTLPLHTIQIGVRLLDAAQKPVASTAVYVGTTVSPKMLAEMTPHELEFLEKLDPQKNFVLEPGHAAPFLIVFIDPPGNLNHFAVAIAKAEPPAGLGQDASAR